MKKRFFILLAILFLSFQNSIAEIPHFLDFKFILNQSVAGKKAQDEHKKMLNDGIKKLKKDKKVFLMRKKNCTTKKLISPEEYKKVEELRSKVLSLQKREMLF